MALFERTDTRSVRVAARSLAGLLAAALLLASGPAAAEHVVLPSNARLHLEPDVTSTALTIVDEEILVELIERKDGWILVRYDGFRGWVREGPPAPLVEVRGGRNVPKEWVSQDLIARGRSLLRNGGREVRLGERTLFTDVSDEVLLHDLVQAAAAAKLVFEKIWEMRGAVRPGSVVFLFASAEAERQFAQVACGVAGPAAVRVAALALSGEGRAQDRDRLLHQVGHLYARDLLGDGVPPWIEEGLATHFVQSGRIAERGSYWKFFSKQSPSTNPVPSVPEILTAGAEEIFGREPAAEALRREAVLFFRYLLEDWKSLRAFKGYVRGHTLSGAPLDTPALEKALRKDLRSIERGYRAARGGLR
jgi:hypothetical protein